jgi:hypothetical protein
MAKKKVTKSKKKAKKAAKKAVFRPEPLSRDVVPTTGTDAEKLAAIQATIDKAAKRNPRVRARQQARERRQELLKELRG